MTDSRDHDITPVLGSAVSGDAEANRRLFVLVYGELRRMAGRQMSRERPGHSLRPTELVHEAYLRIVRETGLCWEDRAHFYAAAAQAMRRLLIEHARRQRRQKRGGGRVPVPIDGIEVAARDDFEELLALDDALERLAAFDARLADVFGTRVFAGLTVEETAEALAVSPATIKRDFSVARAWLVRAMRESAAGEEAGDGHP